MSDKLDLEPDTLPIADWVDNMPDKKRIRELEQQLAHAEQGVRYLRRFVDHGYSNAFHNEVKKWLEGLG